MRSSTATFPAEFPMITGENMTKRKSDVGPLVYRSRLDEPALLIRR